MRSLNGRSKVALCVAISALAAGVLGPKAVRAYDSDGQENRNGSETTFTVYAALDLKTVAPAGAGEPGTSLVVVGNLFKSGDGMTGANANNDPNAGNIIGKILCRATFFDANPSHPYATFVSELYSLPDEVNHLLADGLGPNLGFTAHRIVSGGTGKYRNMVGEIEETEIGVNNTGGCNLRVTFKLTKAGAGEHD